MQTPEPGTYQIVVFSSVAHIEKGDIVVGTNYNPHGYHSTQVVVLRPVKRGRSNSI